MESGDVLYHLRSRKWLDLQSKIHLARKALEQARAKFDTVQARVAALREADFKRADLDTELANLATEVAHAEAEEREVTSHAVLLLNLCNASGGRELTPDDLLTLVTHNGKQVPYHHTIDRLEMRARESGTVETLALTDGAFAEETTLVLTTVDLEQIRFRALGLQGDLPKFNNGQKVRLVQPRGTGTDINESLEATLRVGLEADPNRRTITLYATPRELRPWIRPGVSAFMEVALEDTGGFVLAIPRSAVMKDGITHVFFKRDPFDPDKAIRVEADLGVNDSRWIEIKSDLGPNDEVVLEGAYELKLATASDGAAQKGGHFHADGTFHGEH